MPALTFLNLAGRAARRSRPRFDPPPFWIGESGPEFASVWFPTGGCAWDFRGYCAACNFGHPSRPSATRTLEGVALGLSALPEIPRVLWISSFNVLHDKEVSPLVREQLYRLVAATTCEVVMSESHPSTVTVEAVAACVKWLEGKTFAIEVGAESMNDFIRTWCVHKDFETSEVERAISAAHSAGAQCHLNLMVGAAFLTEAEAVDYAVSSTEQAFNAGADGVVLFPCRVKEHTLLHWLCERNLSAPPSLCALSEVLLRVDPRLLKNISISWLTSKPHPGRPNDSQPMVHHSSPQVVMGAFAEFDRSREVRELESLRTDAVYQKWLDTLRNPGDLLPQRLATAFKRVADELLPTGWWNAHGVAVLAGMTADWEAKNIP